MSACVLARVRVDQVSQYTFAMCSYREKKSDPTEIMQLDGFTVDYCDPVPGASPPHRASCTGAGDGCAKL